MTNTYTFKVKSEDLTTYLREEASWNANEKLEYDLDVDSAEKTINFGDIDNVRLFVIHTDSAITITFTEGTNVIAFGVQDLLAFSPTTDFINNLTGISVSSLGGTANVNIRIYGESS